MRNLTHAAARAIVGWYPRSWRQRYGAELLDVLDQHTVTTRTLLNLAVHAARARIDRAPGAAVMPRPRRRLVALVVTFPLFLVAFAGWFSTDEPLDSDAVRAAAGPTPLWQVARDVMSAGILVVAATLVVTSAIVAVARSRGGRPATRAGYAVGGLVAVGGPVALLAAALTHPRTPPAHPAVYFVAFGAGLLAAIAVLGAAALGAALDRRTALATAVPAAILCLVTLAAFAAITSFGADLIAHGVPVTGADLSVGTYPVTALPAGYHGWLATLIVAEAASLAALAAAAYATLGAVRDARTRRVA